MKLASCGVWGLRVTHSLPWHLQTVALPLATGRTFCPCSAVTLRVLAAQHLRLLGRWHHTHCTDGKMEVSECGYASAKARVRAAPTVLWLWAGVKGLVCLSLMLKIHSFIETFNEAVSEF